MGIFDRVERGLERAVKAPFARVFKAEVQPVEIASAMRGAMDERAAVLGPGRTMVPNVFTIELAKSDYERLASFDSALTDELVAAVEDHADAQRYTPAGTLEVRLVSEDELETGIFRVRPTSRNTRRQPPEQRRPESRPQAPAPAPPRPDQGRPIRPAALPVPPHATEHPGHAAQQTRTFPAADPPRPRPAAGARGPRPWLDIEGRQQPLTAAVTTLGRDASADIVLDDPGVSRRHAEVRISNDGPHLQVVVRDLGSTNGTYLNGDQVGSEQLRDGDRLTMGRSSIVFHLDGGR
jgi:Protein of unknown function (DUF3662)/FHA domain